LYWSTNSYALKDNRYYKIRIKLECYRGLKKIKQLTVFTGLMAILIACGCVGNSLNSNPPEYVQSVSAINGQGLQLYFILADKDGAMTTSDGKFVYEITQGGYTLFRSNPINVTKSSFEKRSIELGNFKKDLIIYIIGRVPYEKMRKDPSYGLKDVKVSFTRPDGKTLENKEAVDF
jgi:hypothetical protein